MSETKPDTPHWLERHSEWMLTKLPGARLVDYELDDGRSGSFVWVPFEEGLEIPAYFEYRGSGPFDWTMHIAVNETGRPQCMRLECRWVTAEQLHRFPLARLLREAVQLAARPVDEVPHRRIGPADPEEARQIRAAVAKRLRKRDGGHRRRQLTDEFLREVANVYRRHVPAGKPSQAVAEHFQYTPSSARRVVREARDRGFLGPAQHGRIGEHHERGEDDG